MGRLPGTVTLCIFLTLSVGATAGTLSPSENDHHRLAPSGLMDSSRDPHNLFLTDSVVGLGSVCWFRLSCPSGSRQDIRGATRPLTFFSGKTAYMFGRWGLDAIHRRSESGTGPIQDDGTFVPVAADTSYKTSTEPQGSAGSAIKGITVIELPLPPAFPLLATGIAALLIFAHRPRHR
jgi:hypothetical protein